MRSLILSLAAVSLLLVGCSDTSTSPTPTYYLHADIDGSRFNATDLSATIENGQILISGQSENGTSIQLHLKDTEIDIFDLGADTYNKAFIDLSNGQHHFETRFHHGEGRVVLTRRVPTEIMGFFSMQAISDAADTVMIERGNFRIRVQQ